FLDYSPAGGLRNISGNSSWGTGATTINLQNSFTAINVNAGTTLTLFATVAGNGLTKLNDGTLVLAGTANNSYTGQTVVSDGILPLNKTGGAVAVNAGNIVINPTATVQLAQNDNQTATGVNVRVLAGGLFDLNDRNTTITDLALQGSTTRTGGGTLTLNG